MTSVGLSRRKRQIGIRVESEKSSSTRYGVTLHGRCYYACRDLEMEPLEVIESILCRHSILL